MPEAWLADPQATALRALVSAVEDRREAEALARSLVRTLRAQRADGSAGWRFDALSEQARSACMQALSRSYEPGSCEALVAWLEQAPAGQQPAVVQALVAMTGREEVGADASAWRRWLDRHKHLPPLDWRTLLLEGQHRRAQRLGQRERDLLARLTDWARRAYTATVPAERPALLLGLLADAEPALRSTATDLLLRELERGTAPPPEVVRALLALLEDEQPAIRQSAAVLIDRIAPEGASARLAVALRKESQPEVASVLLRAYRRFPDPAAADAVLRWLEHGPPTSWSSMQAVESLLAAGWQPSEEHAERIVAVIERALDGSDGQGLPDGVAPSMVRTLVALRGAEGRRHARALLGSPSGVVRRAAAEVLAGWPEMVEPLLDAAETDPALLGLAADAVARHKPWAPLLRRVAIAELRGPTHAPAVVQAQAQAPAQAQAQDQVFDQVLAQARAMLPITARLAELMPPAERLAAAQELSRRPFAVRAILGTLTRDAFPAGAAGDRAYARVRSLLGLPAQPSGRAEPADHPVDQQADQSVGQPSEDPSSEPPPGAPDPAGTDPGGSG